LQRDSLIVWDSKEYGLILVDGHNRYNICTEHKVSFRIKRMSFSDLEEVKAWMIDNQLGRRNLNPDQMSYYRGLKYLALKKPKGGYDNVRSKGQNDLSTTELLSTQFNVSESTYQTGFKICGRIEHHRKSNPQLKMRFSSGK
jgi:hypothetical protein